MSHGPGFGQGFASKKKVAYAGLLPSKIKLLQTEYLMVSSVNVAVEEHIKRWLNVPALEPIFKLKIAMDFLHFFHVRPRH